MGSFLPGRNPTVSHRKGVYQNLIMPTMQRPSISQSVQKKSGILYKIIIIILIIIIIIIIIIFIA